ncbi:MAG: hypothetical protein ACO3L1_07780 [Flavobacteriaceae bacterium]
MPKGIIAVDPGKGGGACILRPDSETIDLKPWRIDHEFIDLLRSLDPKDYESVVEDVPVFVSAMTSNASSFKLGQNFGVITGSLRSLRFPLHLVKPQIWQKGLAGLKPKMGYTARKRVLKDNAVRLFPDLKITNATADAVLIMTWYRNL